QGPVDQALRLDRVDVVLFDLVDHLDEQVEVGIKGGRRPAAARPPPDREQDGEQRYEQDATTDHWASGQPGGSFQAFKAPGRSRPPGSRATADAGLPLMPLAWARGFRIEGNALGIIEIIA